jgi:hypothetical protein
MVRAAYSAVDADAIDAEDVLGRVARKLQIVADYLERLRRQNLSLAALVLHPTRALPYRSARVSSKRQWAGSFSRQM